MFHSYDRDEDGYITQYEAMKAYERWFGQLKIPNDSSDAAAWQVMRALIQNLLIDTVDTSEL